LIDKMRGHWRRLARIDPEAVGDGYGTQRRKAQIHLTVIRGTCGKIGERPKKPPLVNAARGKFDDVLW